MQKPMRKLITLNLSLLTLGAVTWGCGARATDTTATEGSSATASASAEIVTKESVPEGETGDVNVTVVSTKASGAAAGGGGEWGTLKGRFVYDGPPPTPKKVNVTRDQEVCTKHQPSDESVVVDSKGGLANVLVYIRVGRGKKVKVHPDYAATAEAEVVLDNQNCRFEPHVLLVRTGQSLALKNSDPVGHNTNAALFKNPAFNQLIPADDAVQVQLSKAETLPTPVSCNIHPWMSGYLLVRDDPYMAVSAKDGTFEIKDIPVGEHEFQFWQEKVGNLKNIAFQGGKASKRGRADIKIGSGVMDLGEIKISPSLFKD